MYFDWQLITSKQKCLRRVVDQPEGVTTNTGDRLGGVRQGFDDVATVSLRTPVQQPIALQR